ncbi:MAG TPA: L,D-transpeptidase family protein [bacterium]|nr:L,D-transpeptidase family protein [bacterium]HPJ72365.1 L,D-transpeptidase family protein [bacterium]HPQ66083.1 L,D-transpeptidase family protein [bacterium]
MTARTALLLLAGAAFVLGGCQSTRPAGEAVPAGSEPADVIIIDTGELEPGVEAEPLPLPTPAALDLDWEEIRALGRPYTVERGDTLSAIASRYDVGVGLLARINDLADPDRIRAGQTITVVSGPFRVEVDKGARTLRLYRNETLIRTYPVTIGKNDSTPEGEFVVLKKLVNPAWTDPYNRVIVTADDPDYPLGTRWIEFKAPPGAYGIHGSRKAEEIGEAASFGCVRLLHPQEEELYDFLIIGSPVVIRP